MIGILLLASVLLFGTLVLADPQRRYAEPTHAARARKNAGFWRRLQYPRIPESVCDIFGAEIDTANKFVGSVYGKSGRGFGLIDGSVYLADYLDNEGRLRLNDGDIVVVDGPSAGSDVSKRIRVVKMVDGERVEFYPDADSDPHRPRELEEVFAKVSHILV